MGQKYGRWEVVEALGEGGQGHIFKVVDTEGSGETPYVLKRLKNIKRLDRFKIEIEALRNINHPNVARIVDFSLDGDRPYYITDYYSKGEITEHLSELRNDHIKVLEMFLMICYGIAAAHSKGIIHRDIKPMNIMLSDRETPIVSDFGLAYVEDGERHTLTMEAVGPRMYMAPELEDGKLEDIKPQGDIYSLGKLLYIMLSGRIFAREKHRESEYNLSNIDNQLAIHINPILDKSINSSPSERYASVEEMIREIKVAIKSLKGYFNPVAIESSKICRNCGTADYVSVVRNQYPDVHNFGFNLVGNPEWRIYICPNCAHVAIFRPDYIRRGRR